MDFSFYHFGFLLIFFIGSSIGGDPPKNELEIPRCSESIRDWRPEHHTSSEVKENSTKKRPRKSQDPKDPRAFFCLGVGFNGKKEIADSFKNLQPPIVNPGNLTVEEMEQEFYSLSALHRWQELRDYPLKEYAAYWAHVCHHFWRKNDRIAMRKRACHVSALLIPVTKFRIVYKDVLRVSHADLLGCRCYYYVSNCNMPDTIKSNFAVHKYGDNEYTMLIKDNSTRYDFFVSDFLTEVALPTPIK